MVGHEMEMRSVKVVDEGIFRIAQLGSASCNGVEHRLSIRRRTRDYPQYITRRGKLAVALLYLLKQSDILNRDHRLIGKPSDQFDLTLAERRDDVTHNG